MKSFQIRKWQDNYAETCGKEQDKDENLVNAVLECANQLAEINEKLCDKDKVFNTDVHIVGDLWNQFFRRLPDNVGVRIKNEGYNVFIPDKSYVVRLFGVKLFSIDVR